MTTKFNDNEREGSETKRALKILALVWGTITAAFIISWLIGEI